MFKELEYKFKTTLSEIEVQDKLGPTVITFTPIEGIDYYFCGPSIDSFIRYRDGSYSKELTFKQKLNTSNKLRKEIDIKLQAFQTSEVFQFIESIGYSYSFTLKKKGFIIELDKHVLSMYTVHVKDKLPESFIEIEIDKIYTQNEPEAAEKLLETLVENYARFGVIDSDNKEPRSLYEIYVR